MSQCFLLSLKTFEEKKKTKSIEKQTSVSSTVLLLKLLNVKCPRWVALIPHSTPETPRRHGGDAVRVLKRLSREASCSWWGAECTRAGAHTRTHKRARTQTHTNTHTHTHAHTHTPTRIHTHGEKRRSHVTRPWRRRFQHLGQSLRTTRSRRETTECGLTQLLK